jgi:hypothetical protein
VVIACSALKERYRRLLLEGTRETRVVHLAAARELLERRSIPAEGRPAGRGEGERQSSRLNHRQSSI